MNRHGTAGGATWVPSLLAVAVLALFVLLVFGATPSSLLQIPQNAFNAMKASTTAKASAPAAPPAAVSPAPSAGPATPAPFDLKALAASPAEWPKTVALKEAIDFTGVGKHNRVAAGTEVKLVSMAGKNLSLELNGNNAIVSAEKTDLQERVMTARARAGGF